MGFIKGDTRSLDYSSCRIMACWAIVLPTFGVQVGLKVL